MKCGHTIIFIEADSQSPVLLNCSDLSWHYKVT